MSAHRRRRIAVVMITMREDGGAEALMQTLVHELHDEPYDLEFFLLREPRASGRAWLEQIGVRSTVLPANRMLSPVRFAKLVRRLRRGGFDAIHTHLVGANVLGLLAGAVLRIPVVVTLHNTETQADDHWYRGRLETTLIRRVAARVIAVGEETRRARAAILRGTPIHVLPNAVAPSEPLSDDARARLRTAVMSVPERRLLVSVGRLTAQKAHDDMIHAVRILNDGGGDVELAIAGRGARWDELTELVDRAGMNDCVHLLGSRDDVRDLMWAGDVFVMSSHWEGLPVAILEALETGLPVVSTDVGDVRRVLHDGIGRLTPVGDPQALAAAVSDTLDDLRLDRFDRAAARRVVETRFSSRRWAQAMCAHYEAAINGS